MEINPTDLEQRDLYRLLVASIAPRPIAWVSTLSPDGVPNLAPFSYFTLAASNPPSLVICPGIRRRDNQPKDTYANIMATREFVVNLVTEPLAEVMNQTSAEVEEDEFALVGLEPAPSLRVKPPRVAASPIHLECRLQEAVAVGDGPGGGYVVIGTIVHVHIHPAILTPAGDINPNLYQPIARMGGDQYARTSDRFDLARPTRR